MKKQDVSNVVSTVKMAQSEQVYTHTHTHTHIYLNIVEYIDVCSKGHYSVSAAPTAD